MAIESEVKALRFDSIEGAVFKDGPFYRDIVEGQTELICRFNPGKDLVFANDSYCRYFKRQKRELLGRSILKFIHWADRKKFEKLLASLNRKNPVAVAEHRVTLPNGHICWHQWTTRAICDDRGLLVEYQSVGRDITEQIIAEKALREGEERYRRLISTMFNGFVLLEIKCDNNGKPCDCIFVEVNEAFKERTGIATEDIIGKTLKEVLPETKQSWIDACARVAFKGQQIQFKKSFKKLKRDFEIFAYSPRIGQFAAVFTDVTEKNKMEMALRESENNFRMLAKNANDGILIVSDQGAHVYANQRVAEITGYKVEELNKMGIEQLVHPDEVEMIRKRCQRRLAGKPVPTRYETIFIKKGGETVPIEITGSKTVWLGKPAVLRIVRDVTLHKRIERELGEVNAKLEQRITERTLELMMTAKKLEEKKKELLRHKIDLEKANKELVQTNTALSVLARNIDRKRDEVKRKIAQIISAQIIPLVEEIERDNIPEKSRAKLEVLAAHLKNLTSDTANGHDIIISLSSMELRVSVMIKNGFSSEDIARLLHISPHTVKTHRRSIRRKLNIKNSNINLSSYLRLKLGKI